MNKPYTLTRFRSEWAIFDPVSNCYILFGPKRLLKERLKDLNKKVA